MKSAAVPVLSACAFLIVSVPALASQGTRSCGAGAIRAAAAKQVAPRLVGCRYDDVAVPLAQYFAIYPSLTKTPGDDASSTILQQTPAAGEPLTAGGQLALQVSVGPARAPQSAETPVEASAISSSTDTPSTEAPMTETPVIETPVTDVQADLPAPVQKAPNKDAVPAASAEPQMAEPKPAVEAPRDARPKFVWPKLSLPKFGLPKFHLPDITLPRLTFPAYLLRPGLAWAWIGTALVGVLLFFVWRGRRPRSEITYDRVPQVSARFVFGPSRLSASGPLVLESGAPT